MFRTAKDAEERQTTKKFPVWRSSAPWRSRCSRPSYDRSTSGSRLGTALAGGRRRRRLCAALRARAGRAWRSSCCRCSGRCCTRRARPGCCRRIARAIAPAPSRRGRRPRAGRRRARASSACGTRVADEAHLARVAAAGVDLQDAELADRALREWIQPALTHAHRRDQVRINSVRLAGIHHVVREFREPAVAAFLGVAAVIGRNRRARLGVADRDAFVHRGLEHRHGCGIEREAGRAFLCTQHGERCSHRESERSDQKKRVRSMWPATLGSGQRAQRVHTNGVNTSPTLGTAAVTPCGRTSGYES